MFLWKSCDKCTSWFKCASNGINLGELPIGLFLFVFLFHIFQIICWKNPLLKKNFFLYPFLWTFWCHYTQCIMIDYPWIFIDGPFHTLLLSVIRQWWMKSVMHFKCEKVLYFVMCTFHWSPHFDLWGLSSLQWSISGGQSSSTASSALL